MGRCGRFDSGGQNAELGQSRFEKPHKRRGAMPQSKHRKVSIKPWNLKRG